MNMLYDAAIAYWDAGLCPLPRIGLNPAPLFRTAAGGTESIAWGQYKAKQPERALIDLWFCHSDPQRDGIMLLPGSDAHPRSVSATSLQILDFESAAVFADFREQLYYAGEAELLHRCILETTPSGASHLGFRCATISEKPSLKLATRAHDPDDATGKHLLVELLQHHPCTVAPTAAQCKPEHPAGRAYSLTQGTWAHPYVMSPAQRQVLLDTARLFNEVPDAAPRDRSEALGDGTRPGDKLNAAATIEWWQDFLAEHGWRDVSRRGLQAQGIYYFQRPGKTGYQASATYGKTGTCLYVFSENAQPLEGNTAYTPFAAYGLLTHHGDYAAAATALAKVYPPTAEERCAYLAHQAEKRLIPDMTRRLVTRPTPIRQLDPHPVRRTLSQQEQRP
jgi:hypothetical protein